MSEESCKKEMPNKKHSNSDCDVLTTQQDKTELNSFSFDLTGKELTPSNNTMHNSTNACQIDNFVGSIEETKHKNLELEDTYNEVEIKSTNVENVEGILTNNCNNECYKDLLKTEIKLNTTKSELLNENKTGILNNALEVENNTDMHNENIMTLDKAVSTTMNIDEANICDESPFDYKFKPKEFLADDMNLSQNITDKNKFYIKRKRQRKLLTGEEMNMENTIPVKRKLIDENINSTVSKINNKVYIHDKFSINSEKEVKKCNHLVCFEENWLEKFELIKNDLLQKIKIYKKIQNDDLLRFSSFLIKTDNLFLKSSPKETEAYIDKMVKSIENEIQKLEEYSMKYLENIEMKKHT